MKSLKDLIGSTLLFSSLHLPDRTYDFDIGFQIVEYILKWNELNTNGCITTIDNDKIIIG